MSNKWEYLFPQLKKVQSEYTFSPPELRIEERAPSDSLLTEMNVRKDVT